MRYGISMADIPLTTGQPDRATAGYRHLVTRCRETEERHYCVPALQFAVARFAGDGAVADLGAATAVLADAATVTGQPEPRAAFAYALGESALVEVGPDRALPHLLRAVGLLDGLDLPVADALIRHRAAVVLAAIAADALVFTEQLADFIAALDANVRHG